MWPGVDGLVRMCTVAHVRISGGRHPEVWSSASDLRHPWSRGGEAHLCWLGCRWVCKTGPVTRQAATVLQMLHRFRRFDELPPVQVAGGGPAASY